MKATYLLRHLELELGAGGGAFIVLLHLLVGSQFRDPWRVTAIAAFSVMLLCSFLCWWVRYRQRLTRLRALHQVRTMLARCGVEEVRRHPEVERLLGKRMVVAITLATIRLEAIAGEPLRRN